MFYEKNVHKFANEACDRINSATITWINIKKISGMHDKLVEQNKEANTAKTIKFLCHKFIGEENENFCNSN